jgi:hypothetical protein
MNAQFVDTGNATYIMESTVVVGDIVIAKEFYSAIVYDCIIESLDEGYVHLKKLRVNSVWLESLKEGLKIWGIKLDYYGLIERKIKIIFLKIKLWRNKRQLSRLQKQYKEVVNQRKESLSRARWFWGKELFDELYERYTGKKPED